MSITYENFNEAIDTLHARYHEQRDVHVHGDWLDVQVMDRYGVSLLRVTKRLHAATAAAATDEQQQWTSTANPADGDAGNDDGDDDDDGKEDVLQEVDTEVVVRAAAATATATATATIQQQPSVVTYDLLHSPTYQVPVLYLTTQHQQQHTSPPGLPPPPPDEVYRLLVPAAHKPQMRAVGVMGALTLADHPATGRPAYSVHPCRTQEAMRAVTASRSSLWPEDYLLLWLGLVGAGVGLHVPVELARALSRS
ncbi:hypothetical protein LTR36_002339 [Oleoguttula mirabilis]|uniref:Ubiquitin-like-conjugating enzyme ATG10 n=1 Tax=Oleoguttula mirabilis TaxID=1507867 RepID=A0AAV9JL38_9PEZI|nr:hypothetical protein LTR36_002339 [Oleoguttula mirabilis]